VATQKSTPISDVEDVEKIHFMLVTSVALAVDIQRQESENIRGSNGIPKWKR